MGTEVKGLLIQGPTNARILLPRKRNASKTARSVWEPKKGNNPANTPHAIPRANASGCPRKRTNRQYQYFKLRRQLGLESLRLRAPLRPVPLDANAESPGESALATEGER